MINVNAENEFMQASLATIHGINAYILFFLALIYK